MLVFIYQSDIVNMHTSYISETYLIITKLLTIFKKYFPTNITFLLQVNNKGMDSYILMEISNLLFCIIENESKLL